MTGQVERFVLDRQIQRSAIFGTIRALLLSKNDRIKDNDTTLFYVERLGEFERVELMIYDNIMALRYNEGEHNCFVVSIDEHCSISQRRAFEFVAREFIAEAIFEDEI